MFRTVHSDLIYNSKVYRALFRKPSLSTLRTMEKIYPHK